MGLLVVTIVIATLVTLSQAYSPCPELQKDEDNLLQGNVSHTFYVANNESQVEIEITFSKNVSEFELVDIYHEDFSSMKNSIQLLSSDNQIFVLLSSGPLPDGNLTYQIQVVTAESYHNEITSVTFNDRVVCQAFECGEVHISDTTLSHHAWLASPGEWPWLAAIYVKVDIGLRFECGGSLVRRNVIVTAAHCLIQKNTFLSPFDIVVYLGRHNLKMWGEFETQARSVVRLYIHPQYTGTGKKDFDVALLELSSPVYYTETVRPICLWTPGMKSSIVGVIGTVAGWGTNETNDLSEEVQMTNLPVVSDKECRRSNAAFEKFKSDNNFCAGFKNGSGPCHGDSGGGMFVREKYSDGKERWVLRGIVSRSLKVKRNCDLTNYVLFTNMTSMAGWIGENVDKNKLEFQAVKFKKKDNTAELARKDNEKYCTQQVLPRVIKRADDCDNNVYDLKTNISDISQTLLEVEEILMEKDKLILIQKERLYTMDMKEKNLTQKLYEALKKQDTSSQQNLKYLDTMFEVALNLRRLGNYKDCWTTLELVANGSLILLGENHIDTLSAQQWLADMLNKMSKFDRALQIITNVIEKFKKKNSRNSKDLLMSMQIHGEILYSKGEFDKALDIFIEITSNQSKVEIDNQIHFNSLRFKILTLCELNQTEKALDNIINLKKVDNSIETQYVDAFVLYATKNYRLALAVYEEVLEKSKRNFGDDHPNTLEAMSMVIRSLYQLDNYNKSLKLSEELIEKCIRVLDEDNELTLSAQHSKALNLYYLGNRRAALILFKHVFQKQKNIYGENHPSTLVVHKILKTILADL